MKTLKKATVAAIVVSVVAGVGIVSFLTAVSVWANKPRGIRIHLEDED